MKQWTQEELDELTQQTRAWASSEEGQRQIREALATAEETIRQLNMNRRIPWWRLKEPMTI